MITINYETHVSPEVVILLEQAGFDWDDSRGCYIGNVFIDECFNKVINATDDKKMHAPTLSVAQKWLGEVKNEIVLVDATAPKFYSVSILGRNSTNKNFDTYEKALEAGIKKALEIILEGGE